MIFTRDPNVGSKEESNKDGDKEGGIRHTKVRAPEWSLWWNLTSWFWQCNNTSVESWMNLSSTGLVAILKSACRIKARFLRATEEQTQTGIFGIS